MTGAGWGGGSISASVGASQSLFEGVTKTKTKTKTTTPAASAIEAGRNVTITATGTGADSGDITAIGARISAPGHITLNAVRDITLAAAIGSTSETARKRSSSASVGLSYGGWRPAGGPGVQPGCGPQQRLKQRLGHPLLQHRAGQWRHAQPKCPAEPAPAGAQAAHSHRPPG